MPPTNQNRSEKIYNALCLTLSERIHQVDWNSFTTKDWNNFARMAAVEGVAPLIHWNWKNVDISSYSIPTKVKYFLANEYYNTTAQNQVMFQELERILEALNAAGIPVIVLKGAALAATLYPEIGLRPMGDLDLLIQQQDLQRVDSIIRSLEYSEFSGESLNLLSKKLNLKIGHHLNYTSNDMPEVDLEIHWSLIAGNQDWRQPTIEWFWENTEAWEAYSKSYTLSQTSLLLFLCAHMMLQHGDAESRLIWLIDLDLLIRQNYDAIDWSELVNHSNEFHWETAVYTALEKSHLLLLTPIPHSNLELLMDNQNNIAAILVHRKAQRSQTPLSRNLNVLLGLRNESRFYYIFTKIFPDPAFIKQHYNPSPLWVWPFYYPYRWIELVVKAFASVRTS